MEQNKNVQSAETKMDKTETFSEVSKDVFPTRRALEEFNEVSRHHYVTKHGGGTQFGAHEPAALGPMDHDA